MNKIVQLFRSIQDAELIEAIQEIRDMDSTGTVKENGIVRKYARLTGELTGGITVTDFNMAISGILREGAYRFVDHQKAVL